MDLTNILVKARNTSNESRRIYATLQKDEYTTLITKSSEVEIGNLMRIIKDVDFEKLKRWRHNHSSKELIELSVMEVRTKAKEMGIPNAHRKDIKLLREEIAQNGTD